MLVLLPALFLFLLRAMVTAWSRQAPRQDVIAARLVYTLSVFGARGGSRQDPPSGAEA